MLAESRSCRMKPRHATRGCRAALWTAAALISSLPPMRSRSAWRRSAGTPIWLPTLCPRRKRTPRSSSGTFSPRCGTSPASTSATTGIPRSAGESRAAWRSTPNRLFRITSSSCARTDPKSRRSTGQEAYSFAMMFTECLDGRPYRQAIQIFATDVSDLMSIEKARAGVYPETIEGELSPQRLKRFFRKEDHLYRVEKSLRDSCTFARQNLIVDPPFSHMDLISCRNVLIYMAPTLQKRVLPIFHYALNLPGFLVLGSAETVGESTDLFDPIDRAHKIYSKKPATSRPNFQLSFDVHRPMPTPAFRANAQGPLPSDFHREADRVTLGRYAPPGVLVNENLEILQYRGRTGPYLESPPGEPTANLLKMAREGLFLDLRVAVGG